MISIENIPDQKPDKHPRDEFLTRFARAVVRAFDGKPLTGLDRYKPELTQRAARLVVPSIEGPRFASYELPSDAEKVLLDDFRSAFKEPQC